MKYLHEYRDAEVARELAGSLRQIVTRPWVLMEICGGQTHAILKYGIDQLLPNEVTLIHGPGCPVCVTPIQRIDQAIAIAFRPRIILCSFGDMLRVPGSQGDLFRAKSEGADVRMVYSPMEAVQLAKRHPDNEVVFFAVGFETTAPAHAMAIHHAQREGVCNFSMLCAQVLVPPAIESILSVPDCRVQGFLAAGHVCVVMGFSEYEPIALRFQVPIVVTGFEPVDILQGIYFCVKQLEEGRSEVDNQYQRSVRRDGNTHAQALMAEVFRVSSRTWRGLGEIPLSGLELAPDYACYDADKRFPQSTNHTFQPPDCPSGDVLTGRIKPVACPQFGTRCTPVHPLGAPMVSSEGACAAYYRYGRQGAADALQ